MDGDNAADNEKELTSTSCGSPKPLSATNKEERSDCNDTLPTSSTDASTFHKLNSSVSDDPISSTSEMNPSDPTPDKKNVDEFDKASAYDSEGELMLMSMNQSGKVEENVDDLVNDLETLLGEAAPSFNFPGKSSVEKSKEEVSFEELGDLLGKTPDNEVSSNSATEKRDDVEGQGDINQSARDKPSQIKVAVENDKHKAELLGLEEEATKTNQRHSEPSEEELAGDIETKPHAEENSADTSESRPQDATKGTEFTDKEPVLAAAAETKLSNVGDQKGCELVQKITDSCKTETDQALSTKKEYPVDMGDQGSPISPKLDVKKDDQVEVQEMQSPIQSKKKKSPTVSNNSKELEDAAKEEIDEAECKGESSSGIIDKYTKDQVAEILQASHVNQVVDVIVEINEETENVEKDKANNEAEIADAPENETKSDLGIKGNYEVLEKNQSEIEISVDQGTKDFQSEIANPRGCPDSIAHRQNEEILEDTIETIENIKLGKESAHIRSFKDQGLDDAKAVDKPEAENNYNPTGSESDIVETDDCKTLTGETSSCLKSNKPTEKGCRLLGDKHVEESTYLSSKSSENIDLENPAVSTSVEGEISQTSVAEKNESIVLETNERETQENLIIAEHNIEPKDSPNSPHDHNQPFPKEQQESNASRDDIPEKVKSELPEAHLPVEDISQQQNGVVMGDAPVEDIARENALVDQNKVEEGISLPEENDADNKIKTNSDETMEVDCKKTSERELEFQSCDDQMPQVIRHETTSQESIIDDLVSDNKLNDQMSEPEIPEAVDELDNRLTVSETVSQLGEEISEITTSESVKIEAPNEEPFGEIVSKTLSELKSSQFLEIKGLEDKESLTKSVSEKEGEGICEINTSESVGKGEGNNEEPSIETVFEIISAKISKPNSSDSLKIKDSKDDESVTECISEKEGEEIREIKISTFVEIEDTNAEESGAESTSEQISEVVRSQSVEIEETNNEESVMESVGQHMGEVINSESVEMEETNNEETVMESIRQQTREVRSESVEIEETHNEEFVMEPTGEQISEIVRSETVEIEEANNEESVEIEESSNKESVTESAGEQITEVVCSESIEIEETNNKKSVMESTGEEISEVVVSESVEIEETNNEESVTESTGEEINEVVVIESVETEETNNEGSLTESAGKQISEVVCSESVEISEVVVSKSVEIEKTNNESLFESSSGKACEQGNIPETSKSVEMEKKLNKEPVIETLFELKDDESRQLKTKATKSKDNENLGKLDPTPNEKADTFSKELNELPDAAVSAEGPEVFKVPVSVVLEEQSDVKHTEEETQENTTQNLLAGNKNEPVIIKEDVAAQNLEGKAGSDSEMEMESIAENSLDIMPIASDAKGASVEFVENLMIADNAELTHKKEKSQCDELLVPKSESHSLEENDNRRENVACQKNVFEITQAKVTEDIAIISEKPIPEEETVTDGPTSENIAEFPESEKVTINLENSQTGEEEEMAELQLSEDDDGVIDKENSEDNPSLKITNPVPEIVIRRKTVEQDLEKVVCLSEESSDSDSNGQADTVLIATEHEPAFNEDIGEAEEVEQLAELPKDADEPIPVDEGIQNEPTANPVESSNLETIMAVASLQQQSVPSDNAERRLSEKEILEMEAIRMAVASITDGSQDTYDSYMEDNSLGMNGAQELEDVVSGIPNELPVSEETSTEVNDENTSVSERDNALEIENKAEPLEHVLSNTCPTDASKINEIVKETTDDVADKLESIPSTDSSELVESVESHVEDITDDAAPCNITTKDSEECVEGIMRETVQNLIVKKTEKAANSKENAIVLAENQIPIRPELFETQKRDVEATVGSEVEDSTTEIPEANTDVSKQEIEIAKEQPVSAKEVTEVEVKKLIKPTEATIKMNVKLAKETKTNDIEENEVKVGKGSKAKKEIASDAINATQFDKKVDEYEDAQVDEDIIDELKIAKDKMKVNRNEKATELKKNSDNSPSSKELSKRDVVRNSVSKCIEKQVVGEEGQRVSEDIKGENILNAEKVEEKPLRCRLRRGETDKVSEPLSINIDEGEKEKVYSPKVTIKPVKVPDEEVSTTSEAEANKGSLKITITKQSDKMHSILKVYNPEDQTAPVESQEEPIPKLIIKPKIQQVEQQHSPKMSTRSSKTYSPTGARCSSPRVTIKPIPKDPEAKTEAASPIKITFKPVVKPDETTKKHSPKVTKEGEQKNQSPKITIKPIPKPAEEDTTAVTPKVTIKPIKRPLEDPEHEDRSTPKIIIKPVVKPTEQDLPEQVTPKLKIKAIRRQNEENDLEKDQGSPKISIKPVKPPEEEVAEDEVKGRIVLKINKGNLPTPIKDSKKREYPEEDRAEKTGIKLKFSTTGGHTHIVQGNEDSNKRQRKDSGYSGKDLEESVTHKRALEEKLPERNKRLKSTSEKVNESSNDIKMQEIKINPPLDISDDSRSQNSADVTLVEETSSFSRNVDQIADIALRTTHIEAAPQELTVGVVTPTQTPAPKRRGRPRKIPQGVKEELIETPPLTPQTQTAVEQVSTPPVSDVGTPEATPSPGGRPKRSCRTTNVIAALGIKPKKSRGGKGGGRGGKVNMGDREPPAPPPEQPLQLEKPIRSEKEPGKSGGGVEKSKLMLKDPAEGQNQPQNNPNKADKETPNPGVNVITDSVKTEKKAGPKHDLPDKNEKSGESDSKVAQDTEKEKPEGAGEKRKSDETAEQTPLKKKKEDKTPPRKLEVTTRRQKAQQQKEAEAAKSQETPRVETRRSLQKKDESSKVETKKTSLSPKGNPKKSTAFVESISEAFPPKAVKGNPKKSLTSVDSKTSSQADSSPNKKGNGKRTPSRERSLETEHSPGKSVKGIARRTLSIELVETEGKIITRRTPSVDGSSADQSPTSNIGKASKPGPKKNLAEENKNLPSARKGPITRRKSSSVEPVPSTSTVPLGNVVENVIIISTDDDNSFPKENVSSALGESTVTPKEDESKDSSVKEKTCSVKAKETSTSPKKAVQKHELTEPERIPKPAAVETRRHSKLVVKKENEEVIEGEVIENKDEDQTRVPKKREEYGKENDEVLKGVEEKREFLKGVKEERVLLNEVKEEREWLNELKEEKHLVRTKPKSDTDKEDEDTDEEDKQDDVKKEEESDSEDSEAERRSAWVLMRKREAIVKCRAKRMEKLARIAEQKKKRSEQVAQQREARKAVEEAEKSSQVRATKRYGRYGEPKPQISLIDEPVQEVEGTIKSRKGLIDPVTEKINIFQPIGVDDDDPEKSLERHLAQAKFSAPEPMVVDSADDSPTKLGRSEDLVMLDEDTRMSADFRQSAPSTPVKQNNNPSDIVEDSQGSLGTEGGKSRSSKGPPKMEVFQDLEKVFTADQLAEYSWNGQGPFMLQEQVTQFLGIKSFKRKYPNIPRRPVDMQERDYLKENAMVTEAQCDLGLTAVIAQDILDIMYTDFQDKYEDYCRSQREKQARELANKQKALSLTALKPGFDKLDLLEQAIQSAASWNQQLNKARREERRTHMDLQTFTIHYPKSKMKAVNTTKTGSYPVALVPGQFTDYYHEYTPTELNNLPLNTMCYDEIKLFIESDDSSSSSDSESESNSDSSSSYSNCDDKDCKDCLREELMESNDTKETDSDVVFIDNDASSSDSVVLVSVTAPPAAVSA